MGKHIKCPDCGRLNAWSRCKCGYDFPESEGLRSHADKEQHTHSAAGAKRVQAPSTSEIVSAIARKQR